MCEIVEAVRDLRDSGKLLALVQPKIAPGKIGRPATKAATAEETSRAKSFLEELETKGRESASLAQVFGGQGGRNPGGKGIPKRCRNCRALGFSGEGHRANKCPHAASCTEEDGCPAVDNEATSDGQANLRDGADEPSTCHDPKVC